MSKFVRKSISLPESLWLRLAEIGKSRPNIGIQLVLDVYEAHPPRPKMAPLVKVPTPTAAEIRAAARKKYAARNAALPPDFVADATFVGYDFDDMSDEHVARIQADWQSRQKPPKPRPVEPAPPQQKTVVEDDGDWGMAAIKAGISAALKPK